MRKIVLFIVAIGLSSLLVWASNCSNDIPAGGTDIQTESGIKKHLYKNPVLPGFHADPEILYAKGTGKYYIYPTTDGRDFRVFSSENLKDWKEEAVILDLTAGQVTWSSGDGWAPAIEEKMVNGKYMYYFYFSGIPKDGGPKQIGVAIGSSPTGPFRDLGHPIITKSPAGEGQQIDVDVFSDPASGKTYLYWGNGYMAGAELNDDMISIKEETITVLTPKGGSLDDYAYREATYVFFRDGKYYFMWSVDDTGSPNYHVAYGTSKSPLGPIEVAKEPIVIRQRPDVNIFGTGHNSVIRIPGADQWFIVYHRINKGYLDHETYAHREVCIDPMYFNADGTIQQVIPSP